jgi:alcohol dehydrogenase, propanol-preferring
MRAARLHAYGKPLVLDEISAPTPGAGEVLVKIEGAGFCHSDLHLIDGEIKVLPRLPLTLGHENAGIVSAVGAGVEGVREGDAVAVFGGWGCGRCDYCVSGRDQLCIAPEWAGLSKRDGGYAEYLLVPHQKYCIKLGKLAPRQAAPLTDAALTPYRAIKKALPFLEADQDVLVIGLGGLGQYGLKLLRISSACRVIAVDVSESKRRIALELGAAHALDGRDPELPSKVMDLSGGRGVAAAFDFVGSDSTLSLAIGTTKTLGKVTQIGLAGGAAKLQVLQNSRFEVLFEVTFWGTIRELREVIALAESGRLEPIALEYAPLEQINTVYDRLKRGEIEGRAVITP